MELTIREGGLDHPAVVALLEHHLVDFAQHSPAESMHALDLAGLQTDDVTFWSAWTGTDLIGCIALKRLDPGHGEIKSMRPGPRGSSDSVSRPGRPTCSPRPVASTSATGSSSASRSPTTAKIRGAPS